MDDDLMELERDVYREVGEAIRAARKGLGLTLEQLGELSGLSPAYIGQVERDVKKASLQTLAALARALGMSVGAFFPPDGVVARLPKRESIDALLAAHPPRERLFLADAVRRLARGLKTLRRGPAPRSTRAAPRAGRG